MDHRNDSGHVQSISVDGVVGEPLDGGSYPFGITAGPNGDMWFAVGYSDEIGRVNIAPPPPPPPSAASVHAAEVRGAERDWPAAREGEGEDQKTALLCRQDHEEALEPGAQGAGS